MSKSSESTCSDCGIPEPDDSFHVCKGEAPPDAASGEAFEQTLRRIAKAQGSVAEAFAEKLLRAEAPPPSPKARSDEERRQKVVAYVKRQLDRTLEPWEVDHIGDILASRLDAALAEAPPPEPSAASVHSHVYVSSPGVPDTEGCRYPEKLCGKAKEEHE